VEYKQTSHTYASIDKVRLLLQDSLLNIVTSDVTNKGRGSSLKDSP
jgi:hypothetical protein